MTKSMVDGAWIRRFHPGPEGGPTLVCFPHAGGSASYFTSFSYELRSAVQVLAVQYPGRQDRLRDRCLSSIFELAEESYAALRPLLDRPVAFFGHSMGAMIAFEVANLMRERLDAAPATLFVSGRRAPSRFRDESVHLRDDAGLVAELKNLSGTDSRILDDEDVLRMILPSMRSDYRAVESYRYRPGPPLTCPITTLVGEDDDKVDLDEARSWADHTTGGFRLHVFPGGHFYLAEQRRAVADLVVRQLLTPA
ncbi:thioesterase II family protein [Micromonospora sp. WMMD736]|uniref:thioesterase II family protein n=1 Tax=Micromonospora sp. WMMD736 TaxID=3404112 RepID=UPI003B931E63